MSTTTIRSTVDRDGVYPATATIHVTRTDTGADVVAAGTAMTAEGSGVFSTTITDPAFDLTYAWTAIFTFADAGTTTVTDVTAGSPSDTGVVTLAEAKLHCRVDTDDDDALLAAYLMAAAAWAQQFTRRQFLTETLVEKYRAWPSGEVFVLPRPPLVSVTTITYYDSGGTLQTVDDDDYRVLASYASDWMHGLVEPIEGFSWPSLDDRREAVTVTYVAGYGAAAAVPDGIKTAILQLVAHWYGNREAVSDLALKPVPMAVEMLLYPYRVFGTDV